MRGSLDHMWRKFFQGGTSHETCTREQDEEEDVTASDKREGKLVEKRVARGVLVRDDLHVGAVHPVTPSHHPQHQQQVEEEVPDAPRPQDEPGVADTRRDDSGFPFDNILSDEQHALNQSRQPPNYEEDRNVWL